MDRYDFSRTFIPNLFVVRASDSAGVTVTGMGTAGRPVLPRNARPLSCKQPVAEPSDTTTTLYTWRTTRSLTSHGCNRSCNSPRRANHIDNPTLPNISFPLTVMLSMSHLPDIHHPVPMRASYFTQHNHQIIHSTGKPAKHYAHAPPQSCRSNVIIAYELPMTF
jgi:hypothetical protein